MPRVPRHLVRDRRLDHQRDPMVQAAQRIVGEQQALSFSRAQVCFFALAPGSSSASSTESFMRAAKSHTKSQTKSRPSKKAAKLRRAAARPPKTSRRDVPKTGKAKAARLDVGGPLGWLLPTLESAYTPLVARDAPASLPT